MSVIDMGDKKNFLAQSIFVRDVKAGGGQEAFKRYTRALSQAKQDQWVRL